MVSNFQQGRVPVWVLVASPLTATVLHDMATSANRFCRISDVVDASRPRTSLCLSPALDGGYH